MSLRVLIVRLGAMGDVLHAMPAVTALRLRHPDWHLGWAIEPRWVPLLRASESCEAGSPGMPLVDAVHIAHARGWARSPLSPKTWNAIAQLRRDLRAQSYDVCIDLQGAVRSALLGRMAGAEITVGEQHPREMPARWFFERTVATSGVHVIEQALEVVEGAVCEKLDLPLPFLPHHAPSDRWARSLAGEDAEFVLVLPGAGWGAKRWPTERYGEVCRRLADGGFRVIVNAGPGEEEIAEEVVEASDGTARPLAMSLNKLIAMTRRASLVIGGDTGPLHLACALGRPVVGIFGPTDPARNGPLGVPFRVLRHPESRRDHSRRSEPEAGLLTITAEEVVTAAGAVLAEEASA